jgi:hypothetical protein
VNAGGPALTDAAGQHWAADRHWTDPASWGWTSWADAYPELDPALGSRRKTFDAITGTDMPALFQTFRYGRDLLRYRFAVPAGRYRVELYFVEPWYGRTGIDARGWRRFDVAIDGRTAIRDLDIFAEAGFDRALKKVVTADSRGGVLEISFPKIDAGQAILSAIAIAADRPGSLPAASTDGRETDIVTVAKGPPALRSYVDNGDALFSGRGERWTRLPHELLDSDLLATTEDAVVRAKVPAIAYLALRREQSAPTGWDNGPLVAAVVGGGAESPVRFVFRKLAVGASVEIPPGAPALFRRALPSPYAPGQFTFARDATLKEAEAAKMSGGAVATALKGYGGQGYVQLTEGTGRIVWSVRTDVAGRHRMRLRYWATDATRGEIAVIDATGVTAARLPLAFEAGDGWRELTVEMPGMINAGTYEVRLDLGTAHRIAIDSLRFE